MHIAIKHNHIQNDYKELPHCNPKWLRRIATLQYQASNEQHHMQSVFLILVNMTIGLELHVNHVLMHTLKSQEILFHHNCMLHHWCIIAISILALLFWHPRICKQVEIPIGCCGCQESKRQLNHHALNMLLTSTTYIDHTMAMKTEHEHQTCLVYSKGSLQWRILAMQALLVKYYHPY